MYQSKVWSAVLEAKLSRQPQQQQQQQQHQGREQQQHKGRLLLPGAKQFCQILQCDLVKQALAVSCSYTKASPNNLSPSGQGRPCLVAVLLPRSLDYIVASLAALAAGAAFLPLDVDWPTQRLQQVVQSAQPDLLVHDDARAGLAAAVSARTPPTTCCKLLSIEEACRAGQQLQCSQEQQHARQHPALQGQQAGSEQPRQQRQQQHKQPPALQELPFFCVLYTSGSTGTPAGVLCTERGFLNRYKWMQQVSQESAAHHGVVPLQPGHVVAFKTAVSFVDHLWELLAPFLSGADVLLVPEGRELSTGSCVSDTCVGSDYCLVHTHSRQVAAESGVCNGTAAASTKLQQQGLPVEQSGHPAVVPSEEQQVSEQQQAQQVPATCMQHKGAAEAWDGGGNLLLQPHKFMEVCVQAKVTHLVAVPSALQWLLPALQPHKSRLSLQQVVSSGEALTTALAAALLEALPLGCVLVNLYGSTEVSADATCQVVTLELLQSCSRRLPVGMPITNMAVAVVQHHTAEETRAGSSSSSSSRVVSAAAVELHNAPAQQQSRTDTPGALLATGPAADAAASHQPAIIQALPQGAVGEVVITGTGVAAGYLPALSAPTAAAAGAGQQVRTSQHRFQTALLQVLPAGTDAHQDATAERPHSDEPGSKQPQHHPQHQQHQLQKQWPQRSLIAGPGCSMHEVTSQPCVWFRTGDLGLVAGDGTLYLVGRCSHQVKVRGVRVDLLEVEQALSQHPLLWEVAVAAWQHPQRPQDSTLVAYVVPEQQLLQHSGSAVSEEELQQQLRQHAAAVLPSAAQPCMYVMMSHLPRSPAGKVLRSQLPQPECNLLLQGQLQQEPLMPLHVRQQQQAPQPQLHGQQGQQGQPELLQPSTARQMPGKQHSEVAVMRAMLASLPYLPAAAAAGAVQPAPYSLSRAQHTDQLPTVDTAVNRSAVESNRPGGVGHQLLIEPTQDFFTAWGGDSLAAAAVASALGIDVRLVFAYPTARSLAAFLQQQQQQHGAGAGNVPADSSSYPASALPGGILTAAGGPVHAELRQQGQARSNVEAEGPAAKRARVTDRGVRQLLMQERRAAAQKQTCQLHAGSVAQMLSSAATAVVIGHANKALVWRLRSSMHTALPAHQARQPTAAATDGRQSQLWLHHHHPDSHSELEQHRGDLELHWRVPMGRCVDAAPLMLLLTRPTQTNTADVCRVQPAPAAAPPLELQVLEAAAPTAAAVSAGDASRQSQISAAGTAVAGPVWEAGEEVLCAVGQELLGVLVFACSHSGVVKCMDVRSGAQHWSAQLPCRADLGLCLSRCATRLGVPSGGGTLYCLGAADGCLLGQVACGAEVRTPPGTDPWLGQWWVVTHGKELLVVEPQALTVSNRLSLPATASAGMAFAEVITAAVPAQPQRVAVLCLLDGSVMAVTAPLQHSQLLEHNAAAAQQHEQGVEAAQQAVMTVLWHVRGAAPIFSCPMVQSQQGCVIVAAVDGRVRGLAIDSGQQLWVMQLKDQLYADLLLHTLVHKPPAPAAAAAGGGCTGDSMCVVVLATKGGDVYGLDVGSGKEVFVLSLGADRGVSAAPTVTLSWRQLSHLVTHQDRRVQNHPGLSALQAGHLEPADNTLLVCSTDGTVHSLQLRLHAESDHGAVDALGVQEHSSTVCAADESTVVLPGEVFSSPLALGPWVLVGCRDDFLYCLKTNI